MKKIGLIIFAFALLQGCAKDNSMYYWGNYSESLYDMKHEPGAKTLGEHKKALLDIIHTAHAKHKKIPPGIYAELAQIELQANHVEQAKAYLTKEKSLFPESTVFVDSLMAKIKNNQG
jgi:hypothetical protein